MEHDHRRRRPARGALDARLAARRGRRRRKRCVVPCRCWRRSPSRREQSGATSPRSPGSTRPRLGASTRPTTAGRSSASPATDLIWAGGALARRVAGEPGRERVRAGARLERRDAPDRRQRSTSRRRRNGRRRDLLPHLSNGHEVILSDLGHSDDFWTYQPEAADRLINTFLASGRVDRSLYTHNEVDFTPGLQPRRDREDRRLA